MCVGSPPSSPSMWPCTPRHVEKDFLSSCTGDKVLPTQSSLLTFSRTPLPPPSNFSDPLPLQSAIHAGARNAARSTVRSLSWRLCSSLTGDLAPPATLVWRSYRVDGGGRVRRWLCLHSPSRRLSRVVLRTPRSLSKSFTGAQGVPTYKMGLGRGTWVPGWGRVEAQWVSVDPSVCS